MYNTRTRARVQFLACVLTSIYYVHARPYACGISDRGAYVVQSTARIPVDRMDTCSSLVSPEISLHPQSVVIHLGWNLFRTHRRYPSFKSILRRF